MINFHTNCFPFEFVILSLFDQALLVGRAVAQMQSGEWESAASDLQQTEASGLYPAEVQLNTVCCSARLKPEEFSAQLSEFKSKFPNHPVVAKLHEAASAFKEFA